MGKHGKRASNFAQALERLGCENQILPFNVEEGQLVSISLSFKGRPDASLMDSLTPSRAASRARRARNTLVDDKMLGSIVEEAKRKAEEEAKARRRLHNEFATWRRANSEGLPLL